MENKPSFLKNLPIEFDEKNHTYRLHGKLLTGVTTILNVLNKPFLMWWTVKEMFEYLEPRLAEVQGIDQKRWIEILMEAKKAHTKKSTDAKNTGKLVHQWIQNYAGGKFDPVLVANRDAHKSIDSFLGWERAHEVKWEASELIVGSVIHSFAGTLDALAIVDGKTTLLDFKTSSQISPEYFLQTAGYQIALEEMGCFPEQRMIIRIPKDGAGFEAIIVPTDLSFDKECFLHLREVHRWNINIENNFQENGKLKLT